MYLQRELAHFPLRDFPTFWIDPVIEVRVYLQSRSRRCPSDKSQHRLKVSEGPTSPVYADLTE
jgi:hypothetical protein